MCSLQEIIKCLQILVNAGIPKYEETPALAIFLISLHGLITLTKIAALLSAMAKSGPSTELSPVRSARIYSLTLHSPCGEGDYLSSQSH